MFNFLRNRIRTKTYDVEQLCKNSLMLTKQFLKFAAHEIGFSKFVILRQTTEIFKKKNKKNKQIEQFLKLAAHNKLLTDRRIDRQTDGQTK